MMAQYIEIKAANADSLLFYRMGDFYELFFEDAAIASRALGIALTKRGRHLGQDIPMAGVPVVSADEYLSKLIGLGHRVAVCEQIEDPAEARKRGSKSVVRRDVVRLVTPGTVTEEALLEPGRANHLVALARLGGSAEGAAFALAWAELSTGAFGVRPTVPERLLADIRALDPAEIVVADTLFHDEALKPVFAALGRLARPEPASLFDGGTAHDRLCRFFDVSTLAGFGDFSRAELAASAGLLAYLTRTQRAARPVLGRLRRVESDATMLIDPATRASLELTRTVSGRREGSLLAAVDRTVTGAGSRLLAARIAAPLTDPDAIRRRQDSVAFLKDEPRLGPAQRAVLKGLPDGERALSRLALGRGGPRDLGALLRFLEAAREAGALLASATLPAELAEASACLAHLPPDLEAELGRCLAADLPLLKRDGGFVAAGALVELDEARALRDESRRVIVGLQASYAAETGVRSLKIKHNGVLGYFIEVAEAQAGALTGTPEARARFFHRQTMANCMRFSTSDLADLESRIADAAGRALRIELDTFERLCALVVEAARPIQDAAGALAVLDVSGALAELAATQDWVRPRVDAGFAFRVEGGRHPVVEAALKAGSGESFVPNDCDLSPPDGARDGAIWLVTGPNMGGKSTFLRQNALVAVLAQAGAFVPATSAHIGVVDRLFSRVGASDDLAEGRSTFMVEMVETAAILNQAGPRTLVILDEIGRGTSTYDGLSIAFAAVEHLHETNRCRALFATHFHEMTALSKRLKRLSNATMSVKEWEGEVVFLHEVRPGTADRSYGIQVARLAGLPQGVVSRAREVLAQLERANEGRRPTLVDDLPLFSAASRPEPARPAAPLPALEALKALDVDAMSPRDALEALYRLKSMA